MCAEGGINNERINIIVLLILAGVSIATLTGENGILTQATRAKKESEKAEIIEQIQLDIANKQIENRGSINEDEFYEILEKYGTVSDDKTILTTTKGNYDILISDIYGGKIESSLNNGNLWTSGNIVKNYDALAWQYIDVEQELDLENINRLEVTYEAEGLIDNFDSYCYVSLLDENNEVIDSNVYSDTGHKLLPEGNKKVFNTTVGNPVAIRFRLQVSREIPMANAGTMTVTNIVVKDPDAVSLGEEYVVKDNLESMTNGSRIDLSENHIKKNQHLKFSAIVNNFEKIRLGHGITEYGSSYIEIDNTNLYVYNNTNLIKTISHGLTISENISVDIYNTVSQYGFHARVEIKSGDSVFVPSGTYDVVFSGCNGKPFVESINSNLSNCTLEWDCDDFNAPIYAFGDSYFDYWIPKLAKLGYADSVLADGYGGRRSSGAIESFYFDISMGKPKYVLWCMGMNDSDSSDSYNTEWYNTLQEVIKICEENNITLILSTIPNTPKNDNNAKNNWIKNSGFRYIDVAQYVNSYNNVNWDEGMLSSDNVHPTDLGSETIAQGVVNDLQDILNSN